MVNYVFSLLKLFGRAVGVLALLMLCLVFSLAVEPASPPAAKVTLIVILSFAGWLLFLLVRPRRRSSKTQAQRGAQSSEGNEGS